VVARVVNNSSSSGSVYTVTATASAWCTELLYSVHPMMKLLIGQFYSICSRKTWRRVLLSTVECRLSPLVVLIDGR
jgi:hypothetical protein